MSNQHIVIYLLLGGLVGVLLANFVTIPAIEYWQARRFQRKLDRDLVHARIMQDAYYDELDKLAKDACAKT